MLDRNPRTQSRPLDLRCLWLPLALCMLVAAAAQASPYDSCSCSGGTDKWGRSIPASETYCGYVTCGINNKQWECTSMGWQQRGWCGSQSCFCSGGLDEWGKAIPNASTYCGFETCGVDLTEWTCSWSSTWYSSGTCTDCEWCRCYGGYDQNNHPIPPADTYCGYTTLGNSGERWQCTAGGWEKVNNGGPTNNSKIGINTATWMEVPGHEHGNQNLAQSYDMGWYLMMYGVDYHDDPAQISWRIAPSLQDAVSRGLTPIYRLCSGDYHCQYTGYSGGSNGAQKLVSILSDTYLKNSVTGEWYVIVGPNEAPTEKWVSSAIQGMSPGCNSGQQYCPSQVDSIATEIANWIDYVFDNTPSSSWAQNGGDVRTLSPVFDCHHPNTQSLISTLQSKLVGKGRSLADFDAIGVNGYNLHGLPASHYINNCKSWVASATGLATWQLDFVITETGMLEHDPAWPAGAGNGVYEAIALENYRETLKTFRNDSDILGVLMFNPTGRGDPTFDYNVIDQTCKWKYVLGGHGF